MNLQFKKKKKRDTIEIGQTTSGRGSSGAISWFIIYYTVWLQCGAFITSSPAQKRFTLQRKSKSIRKIFSLVWIPITSLSYTLKHLLLSLFFYIECFYCRGLPLPLFKQGKRRKESSRVEQAIEWRDVGDALFKKSDRPLCKCLHSYTDLSLSLSSRLVRSRVAKPVIYHLRVTACDNNYAFDNILVNLFSLLSFFHFWTSFRYDESYSNL